MQKNVDAKVFLNNIEYLNAVSAILPNNLAILKTSYKLKSKLLEAKSRPSRDSNLQQAIAINRATTCRRCLVDYADGPSTFRVERSKKLKRKFFRKLIRKHKLKGKKLTPYQAKILRKILKLYSHKLVTCCQFCKKKTEGKVLKQLSPILKKTHDIISEKLQTEKPKKADRKAKKSKKKDKYCGLNPIAVRGVKSNKNANQTIPNMICTADDDVVILGEFNHRPIVEKQEPKPAKSLKEMKKTKEQKREQKIQNIKAEKRKSSKKKAAIDNLRNLMKEKKKESPASRLAQFMKGLPV